VSARPPADPGEEDRPGGGPVEELKKFSAPTGRRTKLGLLYLDRDRFDDAINEFTFVLASDPGNSQVRFFLGTAYEEKGALPEPRRRSGRFRGDRCTGSDAQLAMLLSRKKARRGIEVAETPGENPGDVELMIFLAASSRGRNGTTRRLS